MRKSLTITHVLNSTCPRAGESIILRTMCPHSNIEMMFSPRREHHLQLTKITTIGNCSRLHEDTYFETHALVEARTSFTRRALQYMLELVGGMQLRNWKPMWEQKPLVKQMKTKGIQVWRQLGNEQVYGMQLETTLTAKAMCKTIEETKAIQVWRPLG